MQRSRLKSARSYFTEGPDPRILEAASRLKKDGLLDSILVGNVDEVKAAAQAGGFDIEGMEIIDPATYPEMDDMVAKMVELRKGKMTEEQCRAALAKGNYFGTMLVKMGKADALLGGATYSTADTVRPALQIIKTKPGNKIVSSCFILRRDAKDGGDELYAMGDCAININPGEDDLVEIAIETAKTAKAFGIDPKVAMLSYSTKGSGKGDTVDMMRTRPKRPRLRRPTSRSTASCSLTRRSPRSLRRPSARVPRLPARRTPSSSRTSTPATSATRSPSVWAALRRTARSSRV